MVFSVSKDIMSRNIAELGKTQKKYPTFLEDQSQFFDELITDEWASYINPLWDAMRTAQVDSLFHIIAPAKILDVGCGCGFHDRVMINMPGVESVVGIDYSQRSIEAADRAYPHERVTRRVGNVFDLPAEGAFDLAVSFQVIEHLSDPEGFLRACASQVRPGGWVAVVTPNRLRLANRLRLLVGRTPIVGDPQHFREYVPNDLVALGRLVGLTCVGRFGSGFSLVVPRGSFNPFWVRLAVNVGRRFPSLADCFGLVFQVGDTPGSN